MKPIKVNFSYSRIFSSSQISSRHFLHISIETVNEEKSVNLCVRSLTQPFGHMWKKNSHTHEKEFLTKLITVKPIFKIIVWDRAPISQTHFHWDYISKHSLSYPLTYHNNINNISFRTLQLRSYKTSTKSCENISVDLDQVCTYRTFFKKCFWRHIKQNNLTLSSRVCTPGLSESPVIYAINNTNKSHRSHNHYIL